MYIEKGIQIVYYNKIILFVIEEYDTSKSIIQRIG